MASPTSPIGITFIPSAENQAQGPQRGQLEGDLGQAFKILSLRLPQVQGARAIAPPDLLNSAGSAGSAGSVNPMAAVFRALMHSMQGDPAAPMGAGMPSTQPVATRPGPPSVIPGATPMRTPGTPPMQTPSAPTSPWHGGPFNRDAGY